MALVLLRKLLSVSEKAANIARVIRSDHRLFHLLIEEKTGDQKNERFFQDFKTLADVLIQETVRHDIGHEFPNMVDFIEGEESNEFTNTLGESIAVEVRKTERETCLLLVQVLEGDSTVADVLAKHVHSKVEVKVLSDEDERKLSEVVLNIDELGIWIDPIDGTSEYIHGKEDNRPIEGIYPSGLQCCTVLIGVYNRFTGVPVLSVVNQPFASRNPSNSWQGRIFWGLSTPSASSCSVKPIKNRDDKRPIVVLSPNENSELKQKFIENGYKVLHGSGAGYKLLCVVQNLADFYILSKGSTYRWDTCAPHTLLCALGGSIVDYVQLMRNSSSFDELKYHKMNEDVNGTDVWCNRGGFVAYSDPSKLPQLCQALTKK